MFSIKNFFSKCEQIRWKLRICSHLLKKSLMENFIFCAVKVDLFGLWFIRIMAQGSEYASAYLNRMGKGFREWTKSNLWKTAFQTTFCLSKPYHFNFFKDSLPQILVWSILEYLDLNVGKHGTGNVVLF